MNLKQFVRDMLILFATLAVAIGGYLAWDSHAYHDTIKASASLQQAAKDGGDTVLIFHKTGCADCRKVVTAVNAGIDNNLTTRFVVDDTKNSDLYKDYQLTEVPTFIRFRNGKEIERYSGTDKQDISDFLSSQTKQ